MCVCVCVCVYVRYVRVHVCVHHCRSPKSPSSASPVRAVNMVACWLCVKSGVHMCAAVKRLFKKRRGAGVERSIKQATASTACAFPPPFVLAHRALRSCSARTRAPRRGESGEPNAPTPRSVRVMIIVGTRMCMCMCMCVLVYLRYCVCVCASVCVCAAWAPSPCGDGKGRRGAAVADRCACVRACARGGESDVGFRQVVYASAIVTGGRWMQKRHRQKH